MKVLQFTYTRVLAFIIIMMVGGNCWALSGTLVGTSNGDVIIDGNATINAGAEYVVKGNLIIGNGATLVVNGSLIVTGSITTKRNNWGTTYGDMQVSGQVHVLGNFNLESNSSLHLINGSKFVVGGDFNQNGAFDFSKKVGTVNSTKSTIVVQGSYNIDVSVLGKPDKKYFPDAGSNEIYVFGDSDLDIVSGINADKVKEADDFVDKYGTISSFLPIELTSFSVEQNGSDIDIAWTTNSEVNNDYFTVEYSIDGVSFKTLETVAGSGTTSEVNEYAITTEVSRFNGLVYFRLKQTDYNGEYSYSDVIALQVESANATDLVIYPNPATEYITISGAVTSAFVSDMHGRRIAVPQTSANTFNVAGLSVGTYYMVATTENGKTVLPFVKE